MLALTLATLPVPSRADPRSAKTVGPSYSCKAAALTRVERMICDDASLAQLDLDLWYAEMEALDDSYAALELNGEQADWLTSVRDACATRQCLADAYRKRIAFMRANISQTAARARREHAADVAKRPEGAAELHIAPAVRTELRAQANAHCVRVVQHIDLGDGAPSLLAVECEPAMLSTLTYLFHSEGGSYRLVYSGYAGYLRGLELQDERSHGLRRLRVQTHTSCCEHPVSYLDYDGTHYRAVACADEVFRDEKHMEFTFEASC